MFIWHRSASLTRQDIVAQVPLTEPSSSCRATEQWAVSLEAALEAEAKAAKTTAAGVHDPAALAKLDEDSAAPGGAAEPLVGLLTTGAHNKVTARNERNT